MTIAPFFVVIIIAIIVTLFIGCCGYALAWRRAEAEVAMLRKQRMNRAIGAPVREAR